MAPSQWDQKADRDLLLAIIDEGSLKSIIWPKISAALQSKGYTFTHEACRQHFQKIRKQSATSSAAAAGADNPYSSAASSPKRKSTPRKKNTSTTANAGFGTNRGNDEEDDEDLPPPPSSKRKRVMKKEENVMGMGIGMGMGMGVGGGCGSTGGSEREAYQFKTEQLGGPGHADVIDLEHEDLYDEGL